MTKTSKLFQKLNEESKTFKQNRIFAFILFVFFAPMFFGSLFFINNHNQIIETNLSEDQNSINSDESTKVLTIVSKEN